MICQILIIIPRKSLSTTDHYILTYSINYAKARIADSLVLAKSVLRNAHCSSISLYLATLLGNNNLTLEKNLPTIVVLCSVLADSNPLKISFAKYFTQMLRGRDRQ